MSARTKRQYDNIVEKVDKYGIIITMTMDDFLNGTEKYPEISFKCVNGHEFKMKSTSLSNKMINFKNGKCENICVECCEKESIEKKKSIEQCEKLGFTFKGFDKKTRKVNYICVCGAEHFSTTKGFLSPNRKSQCNSCQNEARKHSFIDVKNYFEERGCELLSTTYVNRQKLLDYKCICGSSAKIRFADFMAGKRCRENCKARKYRETCQRTLGVDNAFQNPKVKEKCKETCRKKYRVDHCMQNPEIKAKSEKTCLEKYGKKWAFTLPYVYEKIRATHRIKWGVDYPLQCKNIQEKIEIVFQKNWGAKRPFLSEKFIKKYNAEMMEKYGKPWFCMTQQVKNKGQIWVRMLFSYIIIQGENVKKIWR